jgi:hypothetical protein
MHVGEIGKQAKTSQLLALVVVGGAGQEGGPVDVLTVGDQFGGELDQVVTRHRMAPSLEG